jgi:integrase
MNKGLITTTKPIPLKYVEKIKKLLADQPRELAWFALSTNSAFRGGDILSLKISDLKPTTNGRLEILIRERKTKRLRNVSVHKDVAINIKRWLTVHPRKTDYLFEGRRGRMRTAYWSVLLKQWCSLVGFTEKRVATHSCRKTFARTHHERGAKIETLMVALKHSSPAQTLTYINVMPEEVQKLYDNPI